MGHIEYDALDDILFHQPNDELDGLPLFYSDEEEPNMDDEDFQYLLAAQLAEYEEMEALYRDEEVDPVSENGWYEISQELTQYDSKDPPEL